MTDSIVIQPSGPIAARVRPPGSKSITNRALVCAALADGSSRLAGALDSDDTRVMIDSLRRLGIEVRTDAASRTIDVTGCGGNIPAARADLFAGNSGTTIRFLTTLAALGNGVFRLDGVPRMRERPIGDLLEGLRQIGADVATEADNGCPPVIVRASGLRGGRAEIRGDISSQFLSGLLLAAPYAREPVELIIAGPLVSQPYVRITLAVMQAFGVAADDSRPDRIRVPAPRLYQARDYAIEPDASAASYFFAAAAITGGKITVEGLSEGSLQGDVALVDCLARMGCEMHYGDNEITVLGRPIRGIEIDMSAISDTVQTLAAVALFADGPTTIRGVGHIRHKETDRIGNLAIELRKFGAKVDELEDGLRIVPPETPRAATINTYDDHRMAMSLALVGLRIPGVVINDPGCTAKTYPDFFTDLARICERVEE
jgi:3-phosphoshikimate 1-carboxyvinyltransferase